MQSPTVQYSLPSRYDILAVCDPVTAVSFLRQITPVTFAVVVSFKQRSVCAAGS